MFAGKLLYGFGLLFDARGRAMKLHQQHGFFSQSQLGIGIHHANRVVINQLNACNGNAHLNDLNDGLNCRGNAGK